MQVGLSISTFENISFVNHFDVVYLVQHKTPTVLKSTSNQFSQSRLWLKPQKLPCLDITSLTRKKWFRWCFPMHMSTAESYLCSLALEMDQGLEPGCPSS